MNKKIIFIGLILALTFVLGISYAFFNANVIGNGKDIVVVGGSLSLHFEDGPEMTINDAYPGDKIEKIFTVTNTGTLPTSYTMWWKDLTNTFINDELVMSLECTSYKEVDGEKVVNGTCSGLDETPIGTDSSFPIKSNIQIESGIIHEYKIIILFKEMGIIQNYNMNKSFGGTINIKEYFHNETNIPVLESYDMTNKDLVAKVSDTGYIVEYAITDASVTSADDVTWTTIERTSVLDINQVIEDYDIKIWIKNNAGNIMCEDLTPQISLVVKPNGGTWNGSTGEQTYNMTYKETMNIPNPTREGYTFNNWSLVGSESKLSGTTFTAGIENTTLTANWTINEYTLTVNPNGGKYNNSTSNTTYTLDYKESQNISIPEREGYTFTGWSISSNKAQLSTNVLTIGSEDCTLTANWQANNYPWIAYHNKMNVNGSGYTLVDADTKSGEAEYGSKVTPSVNTYTGFTSPSEKEITIVVDSTPPTKNVVDYNYERNKYALTIDANGGTYSGNNPGEIYYEEEVTIANPTKEGYNFGGWTKTGGGTLTDTIFKGGSSASTLTATWNPIESTVTFNSNGAGIADTTKTVLYNSTYGDLPSITRANYEFLGWFTEASGGTEITSDTIVSITSSQTLYAHWKETTVNVTYDANGGTGGPGVVAVLKGSYTLENTNLPTKSSYGFIGWSLSSSDSTNLITTYEITGPITFYAQYSPVVARVGTTDYLTLQNAIDVVPANNAVTEVLLLTDVTEDTSVPANKNISLNLNNKTLTGKMVVSSGATVASNNGTMSNEGNEIIENNGTYTINGGTYVSNYYQTSNVSTIVNNGTLNIKGGTTTATGGYDVDNDTGYAVGVIMNTGTVNMSNGTVGDSTLQTTSVYNLGDFNLSGGTITLNHECSSECYYGLKNGYVYSESSPSVTDAEFTMNGGYVKNIFNDSTNVVNINSGEIECDGCDFGGNTTITGGTFHGGNETYLMTHFNGNLSISGGTFTSSAETILFNSADYGTLSLTGGTYTENSSSSEALWINPADGITLNISNLKVTSNGTAINIGSQFAWGETPMVYVNFTGINVNCVGYGIQVGTYTTVSVKSSTIKSTHSQGYSIYVGKCSSASYSGSTLTCYKGSGSTCVYTGNTCPY